MRPKRSRIATVAQHVKVGFISNVGIWARSGISGIMLERPWDLIHWHTNKLTHS